MDNNKKNRADLKRYFIKNAIPTESNFADLIDAAINQRDDGLAKPSGEPLSIEASPIGNQTAIRLYHSFSDPSPAWMLSLMAGDPAANNKSLVLSDGTGNPKLSIDETTGALSVGAINAAGAINAGGGLTVAPGKNLTVNGSLTGLAVETSKLTLKSDTIDPHKWVSATLGGIKRVDFDGNLKVDGDVIVSGNVDGRDVSSDGSKLDAHISDATNPHTTTAAQIDSEGGANRIVTQINAGSGTIAEGRIDATIARDAEVAARFDVSSGHDHDGIDSKRIPAISSAYFSDLSGASLTSLNATQITSGTLAEARIDSTITRDSEVAARFHVTTGHNHDGANSRKLTAADVGALSTSGGGVGSTGTMSTCLRVSQTAAASACAIQGIVSAGGGPGIWWAAVAGVSDADSTAGVYASASKTYALRVEGTSYFSGAKTGYVVDLFINGDTTQLHTGDVVRLKGTPVARYHGEANKIPVTEVVRANRGSDGLVIGIVDREALPTHAGPDERKNPEDPTTIDPGGELTVVTLGAYAHCRVDATRAPISVGDLLTSSATEGCAEKATKPQLGTIIGKALEPLASGIDYIAVFVNIQ